MFKDGKEFLEEQDKTTFDIVKLKMALAAANAEKALAQTDVAKLVYSNLILQFSQKYNLSEQDGLTEEGEIVRKANENIENK